MSKKPATWHFIDEEGTFRLENPNHSSYLYFPLVNEAGMMSAITPTLNGDVKINQNAFLTLPVSIEDLHNTRSARNFWVMVEGLGPWSVTGNSALQTTERFSDDPQEEVTLEAGVLWHKIMRRNQTYGLEAEITNFVPTGGGKVELMKVSLSNVSGKTIMISPTAAIPIYGRSADNLRNHRHVTSLLHRIRCEPYGVLVRPTLSFDERGHLSNSLTYAIMGSDEHGETPVGFFPLVETFTGEGGTLDWPEAIINSIAPTHKAGQTCAGHEAMGGLRFKTITLQPEESTSYVLILAILDEELNALSLIKSYGSETAFDSQLEKTKKAWKSHLQAFKVKTNDSRFDQWMHWISLQPTLRRLYGNSFLPAHDYGRGGRGWRDLWQDILALLLMEEEEVSESLFSNFAGVRIDGSNATIIGSAPGEFKADRNDIPRVWMDHGAWPLLTTNLYLHQTGDLAFLLREQTYFKDHLVSRAKKLDEEWKPNQGTQLLTEGGRPYLGSILEHLLIQHLIPFFNVGSHNNILLEGADWNDGMDMASERGESVAFSSLYAGNLHQLSEWVLKLGDLGVDKVELATEILPLLDTLESSVDYESVKEKRVRLDGIYESCTHTISGSKVTILLQDLAKDLATKADWMTSHLRTREWIKNKAGFSWFNSYYDNHGQRVEGDHPKGVRMILTGQVFALMGNIATAEQALEIICSVDQYLYDPVVGGYRLNTDFREVMLNLGRAFGYAYGHKENGAMFSHMAVMYANALYQRGLIREGYKVLESIYQHCQDFPTSRIYPGIPEYIDSKGRGMYTWLTGSASWYLLTLVTEVFGVRGYHGDLTLAPKLTIAQFNQTGNASLITRFAGKLIEVTYQNPGKLDYDQYLVISVSIEGEPVNFIARGTKIRIARENIENHPKQVIRIGVQLGSTEDIQ